MSNEVEIIEQLTEEFTNSFGAEKGIAILSSVICQMYTSTDQKNAMVLAQPTSGVIVITTTLDCSDQIPEIVETTKEQLGTMLEKIESELKASGKTGGVHCVDGDTGETLDSPDLKPPVDKTKLH